MRDLASPLDGIRSPFGANRGMPALDLNLLYTLDPRVTFTRASTATYFNSTGVRQTAAVDAPRFDYDPATLQPRGLLIEGARTNLMLNSAALATQAVTVTAQSYTLSFQGTGTVTMSGAYAGSLVGTGAANRVTLTFTATAGTLTATVSGAVTQAQLEAGAYATSYIPTTAAAVTRAADVATMTGANFSSWFNPVEGAFVVDAVHLSSAAVTGVLSVDDATSSHRMQMRRLTNGIPNATIVTAGAAQFATSANGAVALTNGLTYREALAYAADNAIYADRGLLSAVDTTVVLPTLTRASLGGGPSLGTLDGYLRRLRYYRTRLPNARLQELTA